MRTKELVCRELKKTYVKAIFDRDQSHPMQQRGYDAIEDFKGLRPTRKCTEKRCLTIYGIVNIAVVLLGFYVIKRIEFHRLLLGQDFRCDFCGIRQLTVEKYVYWPDPVNWGPNVKTCVPKCPESSLQEVCLYNQTNNEYVEDYCLLAYKTKKLRNYCVPDEKAEYVAVVMNEIRGWNTLLIRIATDIYLSKIWLFAAVCLAVALSMISSLTVMIDAAFINKIWLYCMLLINIGLLGVLMLWTYQHESDMNELECSGVLASHCGIERQILYKGVMAFCAFKILHMIYIVSVKCAKVNFNFRVLPVFARPIRMCTVILTPILFSGLLIIVYGIFLSIFVLFMTTGYNELVLTGPDFYEDNVRKTIITDYAYYGSFFLLLALYFHSSFIIATQRAMIGTLVSQWYFSKHRQWLRGTFFKGIKAVYYHLGTMMYHSYIEAFIQPWRLLFEPLKRYINRIQYSNKMQRLLICCCKCCVMWYDTNWKYKASDTLYQTALFADPFLGGGIKLFYFKYRNWSRYEGFDKKFFVFSQFQGIFVSASAALFVFGVLIQKLPIKLNADDYNLLEMPILMPILVYVSSMYICRGYTYLMDYSFELNVLCFVADEEMFQGTQRFASKKLREFFDLFGQEAEKFKNINRQENIELEEHAEIKRKQRKQKEMEKIDNANAGIIFSDEELSSSSDEEKGEGGGTMFNYMSMIKQGQEDKAEEDQRKADEENKGKKKPGKVNIPKNSLAANYLKNVRKQAVKLEKRENKIQFKRNGDE